MPLTSFTNVKPDAYTLNNKISGLADDKTYGGLGEKGAQGLVRTGKGFFGKVANWFKEAFSKDTVKIDNQRALDALARTLTEQYGEGALTRGLTGQSLLTMKEEFAAGKKYLTGTEIKRMANAVKEEAFFKASKYAQSMLDEITLLPGSAKPEQLLGVMMKHLPTDMPVSIQKEVLGDIFAQMQIADPPQPELLKDLKEFLFSQTAFDLPGLLGGFDGEITRLSNLEPGEQPKDKIGENLLAGARKQRDSLLCALPIIQDAMRLFLASEDNTKLDKTMPEPPRGTAGWSNPSSDALQSLQRLGITPPKEMCKASLEQVVRTDQKGSFLRMNELGVKAIRKEAKEIFSKPLPEFMNKLLGSFSDLVPEGGAQVKHCKNILQPIMENPEKLQEMRQAVFKAMQDTPAMMEALKKSIALLQENIRPVLDELNDKDMREKMIVGFNGIVGIGGLTAPMTTMAASLNEPDKSTMNLLSVFLQLDMRSDNLVSGQPWGDFLATIPGWNALIAPATQLDPENYHDTMGDPKEMLG